MWWDKLAILIPTRNRPNILAVTLDGLRKAGFGAANLFVYDDASDDVEAVRRVVGTWPGAKLICGQKRVGQAAGRNVLMRECGREYGLLLEDDTFPDVADGIPAHVGEMPGADHIAVVGFQCRSLDTGGLSVAPTVSAGFACSFLGGACLFHIPSVLAIGGFRRFFVYGYEEPELAMRLWLAGFRVWYDPSVIVLHNQFQTPDEKRDDREYDYLYSRNVLLMLSLNMPLWFGLPHGLARSLRRLSYRRRNSGAKIRGTIAGLWLSFALWKERKPCSLRAALEWLRFRARTRA
jgi:GT2 family glycosyltransferase